MRVAVIRYPGSNADFDAFQALRALGMWPAFVFHKSAELGPCDAIVIPGGFSYGDYLRPGSIARFSPISSAVIEAAQRGVPTLGICNGFQILTELGLLPGALAPNEGSRFVCRDIWLRTEAPGAFTSQEMVGKALRLPIAHANGRYVAEAETLRSLQGEGQVAFRYVAAPEKCDTASDAPHAVTQAATEPRRAPLARSAAVLAPSLAQTVAHSNPNGSIDDIAGIYDARRRVLGLMPHPERASESVLGNSAGAALFESLGRFMGGETR